MAFRRLLGNTTKTPSTSPPLQLITFVLLNYFTYTYLMGDGKSIGKLGLPSLFNFVPLLIIVISFLYLTVTKRIKVPYLFFIYSCFLGAILCILPLLSAPNPRHSFLRAGFAVCLWYATFGFFFYLNSIFEKQPSLRRMMLWSLLLGLIVSIVRNFYFPDPNIVSSPRFDGGAGIAKNLTIGPFALLSVFWAHYTALQDKHWYRVNQFTWAIGIYVLLLTLSRANIISLGIVYTLYLLVWGGQILIQSALKGEIPRLKKAHVIGTVIGTAVGTGTLIVAVNKFMSTSLFAMIVARMEEFADEGGGGSRLYTVKILLDQVNDSNFWFGSMGWWYHGEVMKHLNYSDLAIHAHNTYIRLLVEVGFIGLIAVMLLPICLFFVQIQRVVRLSRYGWTHEFRISTLLLAMLFTLFVKEMAYQTYMMSTGGIAYSLIVFVMVLVYSDFSEKIIKKSHHTQVTRK